MATTETLTDGEHPEGPGGDVTGATNLLKAIAHESRLMILCLLVDGEKTVGELEELTTLRQPNVSQQLARLRFDGLVNARRDGRTMYYSLGSQEARKVVSLVHDLYCSVPKQ